MSGSIGKKYVFKLAKGDLIDMPSFSGRGPDVMLALEGSGRPIDKIYKVNLTTSVDGEDIKVGEFPYNLSNRTFVFCDELGVVCKTGGLSRVDWILEGARHIPLSDVVKKPSGECYVTMERAEDGSYKSYLSSSNGSPFSNIDYISQKFGYPKPNLTNEAVLRILERGGDLEKTNMKTVEEFRKLEKELKETEEKLKEVIDEKTTAFEKLSKLQKDMRELEKEQPVIEKVLSDVKEEFNKCNLAQKLDTITNKLQGVKDEMVEVYYSPYSLAPNQSRFENFINNMLSDPELLKDQNMKSNMLTTVGEMLDMLKNCGSQAEERLYLITEQIDYINENMVTLD